jgi:hypothetical protein
MRRLARHLFTLCSATSLLLCVATCVLWVCSYVRDDGLQQDRYADSTRRKFEDVHFVFSNRGSIGIGYARVDPPGSARFATSWRYTHIASNTGLPSWPLRASVLGFHYWNAQLVGWPGPGYVLGFGVPHALLAGMLAIPPAIVARRVRLARRRRRRLAAGMCPGCGYDTRASPARCPEMFSLL